MKNHRAGLFYENNSPIFYHEFIVLEELVCLDIILVGCHPVKFNLLTVVEYRISLLFKRSCLLYFLSLGLHFIGKAQLS